MNLQQIRKKFERLHGEQSQIEKDIRENKKDIKIQTRELHKHEQAKEIIREVGMKTQQQLQFHISDITSLALEAVFPKPYKLVVEFVQRRNKTECDLYFERGGKQVDPLSSSGGGAIDIAAFALRIASWSLQRPHSRATIILDEPLKWIDETLREKGSNMIKEVSDKLGIQFIIVTHDPMLTKFADKVFEVRQKRKVSKIYTK